VEANAGDLASELLEVIPSYILSLTVGRGHICIAGVGLGGHNAVTQDVVDGPHGFPEPTVANHNAPPLGLHLVMQAGLQWAWRIWDYDFHRGWPPLAVDV
jgi:hypothetical protein